ncbi:NAD(P)-binding protein [Hypoxylon trugodes]|uniref:NAD(P)-binding protein n=1 Tax=Hypoxylon trugodes TaxID=326681 RepID=UPI00219FE288|nr:NAD(P)-binding protein [Hypoxylon trugodes]KAI1388521.1 NAD(P)-binding protein [Hypoxylon trugodes]
MAPNTSSTPDQAGRWIVTKFGGPDVLKWETFDPYSELSADGVIVRIIVGGIAGPDNLQRVGGYPNPLTKHPGFTPGYDFVGEVIALGPSVPESSKLAVGDHVTSMCVVGAHATHTVIRSSELIRIERTDDPIKVCALPLNYMTAWGMLDQCGVNLPPGSTILVGSVSGGLGTAVAEIVRAFDFKIKIIGTCSPSKFDYVKSLGVIPIDRHAPDLVEQVKALTNGEGVDVAYDAVGSDESLEKSYLATKKDVGQVIVTGIMSEIATDGSGLLQKDNFNAHATIATRMRPRMKHWSVDRDFYQVDKPLWFKGFYALLEKVRSGELSPTIAKLFRLSEGKTAHEYLVSGTAVKGKMVFIADGDLAAKYGL